MLSIDFQELFEKLPSPHMVLDRGFNFVVVNPAYEHAVMRRREELIGRNLFELFPNDGEGGARLRGSFEHVFATGESDTLAYIPYDIPRPPEKGGGIEQRYWTSVHTPLGNSGGDVELLMQNTVDVTEVVHLRHATALPYRAYTAEMQLIERAREAEHAQRAVLAESTEFRRMFQQAPQMIAILSGPEHVFTFTNDAYTDFIGGRQVLGLTVRAAVPEVAGQGFFEMLDDVFQNGRDHGGQAVRVVLRQRGSEPQEAFMDFSYRPIRDLAGRVTGVFVQGMDRTQSVLDLRRQRLLLDELNHRVKNTLATVQSIASQTLRSAPDVASAKKAFEARILALSKAHNILSARHWSSAELGSIVAQELAAHGTGRIESGGPRVMLNPKASIAVAMLIHELSTNAAKFGALSGPDGLVNISWSLGEDGQLAFSWKESGGPPVAAPARAGFGARLIERVVTGELSGRCESAYDRGGFGCRFHIPEDAYGKTDDALRQ